VQHKDAIIEIVKKYSIDTIYHLASLLSATSEKLPDLAWDLNLVSLKHILEISKDFKIKKVRTKSPKKKFHNWIRLLLALFYGL